MTAFFRRTKARFLIFVRTLSPVQTITLGYAFYIFAISLLLWLPFTWNFPSIAYIDHLFMAASAVSTTGLVTVNTPEAYNFWGQLVLVLGFQVGGLGYMTFGSFVLLASRQKISYRRLVIGRFVLNMPEHFHPKQFIYRAVGFTLLIETLGTVALFFAFRQAGANNPLWSAIFHAVSAFCTAGFSVFPDSLESYRNHMTINAIIAILSIFGAIGFIVVSDVYMGLRAREHKMTLTSRIILTATASGITLGTLAMFFDSSVRNLPFGERLLTAFFQAMSALTTVGFNTHPIGALSLASLVIVLVLMILGASPSGTGGGLKSTTWTAGLAATWSAIHSHKRTMWMGYAIPEHRVRAAFGTFTLYLIVFCLGCYAVLISNTHSFEDNIFEVASALSTVGLSRGITGDLTIGSKITLILLMYIGRVGVISLAIAALAQPAPKAPTKVLEQDVIV